jgi:hypothetical protein
MNVRVQSCTSLQGKFSSWYYLYIAHDLDITKWGTTNQKVITAIREITPTQKILVSGTQFARLTNWISSSLPGIGPGHIKDPANNILYDFHQYFDDLGGAYGLCEPWSSFSGDFQDVTSLLRKTGHRAVMTEFGGGPFTQCKELYIQLLEFFNENSDVWFGWTTWGSYSEGDLYLSTEKNSPYYLLTEVLERYAPLTYWWIFIDEDRAGEFVGICKTTIYGNEWEFIEIATTTDLERAGTARNAAVQLPHGWITEPPRAVTKNNVFLQPFISFYTLVGIGMGIYPIRHTYDWSAVCASSAPRICPYGRGLTNRSDRDF